MIGGFWHLHREPLWLRLLLLPLLPFEWFFRLAVSCRAGLYRLGIFRRERVGIPVLSVGNLAVGGAGKTPIVIHLATLLQRRGLRVAVLSQGYGGLGQGHRIASLGEAPLLSAEDAGDEPILIAKRCPGVQVLVGPSRVELARIAEERLGAGVVILDDGFQHLALSRGLDLVVLDGAAPFGNGRLLPRGPLREAPSALARAGLGWISKADEGEAEILALAEKRILAMTGKAPIRSRYQVAGLFQGDLETEVPREEWEGRRIVLLAGLARPASFRMTVEGLGLHIAAEALFRDHHRFSDEELRGVLALATSHGASHVVCTEKDAVRLPPWFLRESLLVVRIEVEILEGGEILDEALTEWLRHAQQRAA